MLGFIKRVVVKFYFFSTVKVLYCSLVRSILEHAAHTIDDIRRLERVCLF